MTTESWRTERYASEEGQSQEVCKAGNVQEMIADKLHKLAQTLSRKTASTETESQVAYYSQQASDMLEESAEYLKQLDLKNVEASVRDFIRNKPGQSLLIAGAAGLVIGAILRRR